MSKAIAAATTTSIPIISLNDGDSDVELAKQLRAACIDYGFFYLTNHGIAMETLQSVMDQSKALFALPLEEKQSLSDPEMSRGYTAMEAESLDPTKQTQGDTKEGYYIGRDIPYDHPLYDPKKLRGPNRWPRVEILPNFRSVMEDYHDQLSKLALKVVQLLAISLNLESLHFFDKAFEIPMSSIRLLHYDGNKLSNPDRGIFACGAHSDYGMLTLLLTDENPGLQILTKQNQWIDINPMPNAFVVNLGDMLERWTNGLFSSTVHRVLSLSPTGNGSIPDRYSIPFFF